MSIESFEAREDLWQEYMRSWKEQIFDKIQDHETKCELCANAGDGNHCCAEGDILLLYLRLWLQETFEDLLGPNRP